MDKIVPEYFQIKGTTSWKGMVITQSSPWERCLHTLPGTGTLCTCGGEGIVAWLCHSQVLGGRGDVSAVLALSMLVGVHTEGIDSILHGTEALVEGQALTRAQVLRG